MWLPPWKLKIWKVSASGCTVNCPNFGRSGHSNNSCANSVVCSSFCQYVICLILLLIYGRTFYTCSWSCTHFHYDISAQNCIVFFFIENCPKLHASKPNFGQTLICCSRPKLRFCSLTSNTETCFKKTKQFWANINNFVDLVCIFEAVKLKIVWQT